MNKKENEVFDMIVKYHYEEPDLFIFYKQFVGTDDFVDYFEEVTDYLLSKDVKVALLVNYGGTIRKNKINHFSVIKDEEVTDEWNSWANWGNYKNYLVKKRLYLNDMSLSAKDIHDIYRESPDIKSYYRNDKYELRTIDINEKYHGRTPPESDLEDINKAMYPAYIVDE